MKKLLILNILLLIMIFSISTDSYAAFFKQCEYVEKNQWGALEEILNDWKTNKITTDECAIYGCYVLVAQEPSRIDSEEKKKLLLAKYSIDKKSTSADPYFFIDFLYDNENNFGEKALQEFRTSDWSDYEYLNNFTSNDKILKIIENTPFKSSRMGSQYRDIATSMENAVKNKYIDEDAGYLIIFQTAYFNEWFENRHKDFVSKYKLTTTEANEWLPFLCNTGLKISKSNKTKTIKLLNYFNDAKNKEKFSKSY